MGKIDHDILVVVVLLVLSGSAWGAKYSLDSRGVGEPPSGARAWPLALLALLIGLAMFSAGWTKLVTGWLDPSSQAVKGHLIHNLHVWGRPTALGGFLLSIDSRLFWELADWGTVLLELAFLPASLSVGSMRAVIAVATLFHAAIHFSMEIFFLSNLVAYAAFVEWGRLRVLTHRRWSLPGATLALERLSIWWLVAGGVLLGLVYVTAGGLAMTVFGIVGQGEWALDSMLAMAAAGMAGGYLISRAVTLLRRKSAKRPVILFDGVCGLCNRWVDFVLRWDRKKSFLFAPLQSDAARTLLEPHRLVNTTDSIVLVRGSRIDRSSTAVLEICRLLGTPWAVLYPLILVPRVLRDGAYELVANHRYRWFGKREACRMPTPDERPRFLQHV